MSLDRWTGLRNFLRWIWTLFLSPKRASAPVDPMEADRAAIASDWSAVGRDIDAARKCFETEKTPELERKIDEAMELLFKLYMPALIALGKPADSVRPWKSEDGSYRPLTPADVERLKEKIRKV